jgi:hypothetical protein
MPKTRRFAQRTQSQLGQPGLRLLCGDLCALCVKTAQSEKSAWYPLAQRTCLNIFAAREIFSRETPNKFFDACWLVN